MRPIDADALIEFCAERWIPLNIDAVNMQPTIQPVATDANVGSSSEIPNTSDCISRQKAIDALKNSSLPYVWQGAEIIQNLPTIQPEERTEERTEMHACDLISRSEAIDALDKQIKQCCKALGSLSLSDADKHAVEVEMASFRAYREMLENLPTVQPEPKWIPVSERLPETEEFVLASLTGKYRNTTFEHACEIADYADGEWCVYAYPGMSAEKCAELIEAWMPLPEPYKPNKKQSGKEGT